MTHIPEPDRKIRPPKKTGLGFTYAAAHIARFGVVLGLVVLGFGFAIATSSNDGYILLIFFVAGLNAIIGSVIIGVLSEISFSVAKTKYSDET